MSFSFKVNMSYATNALAWWDFISLLLAAGWTKVKDSDGITYSSSGTQLTGGGSGAHGFDNGYAWFVLQYPGTTRQICVQRDNGGSGYQYGARIKYSYAGFSGGSPSATQVPAATDELIIGGSGTDAAPGLGNMPNGGNGQLKFNMCVGGKDERYAFYFFAMGGQTSMCGYFFFDPMAIGSYDPSDPDPFVIGLVNSSYWLYTGGYASGYMGSSTPKTLGNDVVANSQAYLNINNLYTSGILQEGVQTQSHITGKDFSQPIYYLRRAASSPVNGFKGHSTLFQYISSPHSFGEVVDYLGAGDRLHINKILMPWPPGRIPFMPR